MANPKLIFHWKDACHSPPKKNPNKHVGLAVPPGNLQGETPSPFHRAMMEKTWATLGGGLASRWLSDYCNCCT